MVLLSGRVKVTIFDSAGRTLTLAVRGAGEVLGEIGLLSGSAPSATVTAIDSCEVRSIPGGRFRSVLREFDVEGELVRFVINRLRESEGLRLELATMSSAERVLRGLSRLAVPDPAASGGPAVVTLDQAEFGKAVGVSRSSVAAEFTRLRGLGVISTRRGRIEITDPRRLRALIDECDACY